MKTWSMRYSSMTRCSSVVSPSDRQARRTEVPLGRIVVEETDHLDAEVAVGDELLGDVGAELAGADDQDALQVSGMQARAAQQAANRHPKCHYRDELERREESQEGAAVGEVLDASGRQRRPVPGRDAGEQDGAQDDRQHDRDGLVDAGAIEALAVEAVEVEDHREEHQRDRQELEVAPEVRRVLGQRDDFELEAQRPGTEKGERGGCQIAEQVRRRGDSESLLDQLDSPSDSGQKGRRYPFRRVVNRSAENSSARLRRSMRLNCIRWILSIAAASVSTPGSSTSSP